MITYFVFIRHISSYVRFHEALELKSHYLWKQKEEESFIPNGDELINLIRKNTEVKIFRRSKEMITYCCAR